VHCKVKERARRSIDLSETSRIYNQIHIDLDYSAFVGSDGMMGIFSENMKNLSIVEITYERR
jgi:hypothetical protein